MPFSIKLHFLILFTTILSACSQTPTHSPRLNSTSFQEVGKASFYANKYQSRQTASGERFNHSAKTAAHKKLPFGTWVKVTNINNDKSVMVRINDRGPFVKGRIIDLSKSAFSTIADTRLGIIDVVVEVVQ